MAAYHTGPGFTAPTTNSESNPADWDWDTDGSLGRFQIVDAGALTDDKTSFGIEEMMDNLLSEGRAEAAVDYFREKGLEPIPYGSVAFQMSDEEEFIPPSSSEEEAMETSTESCEDDDLSAENLGF